MGPIIPPKRNPKMLHVTQYYQAEHPLDNMASLSKITQLFWR